MALAWMKASSMILTNRNMRNACLRVSGIACAPVRHANLFPIDVLPNSQMGSLTYHRAADIIIVFVGAHPAIFPKQSREHICHGVSICRSFELEDTSQDVYFRFSFAGGDDSFAYYLS